MLACRGPVCNRNLKTYCERVYNRAMNATPVNKEQVRAVVLELGYNEAGAKLNIKPATLRQWAKRFHWNEVRRHAQETVTSVTSPVQVLADELAENERETRLSLSRYAKRAARDAESATLKDSPYVKQAAQVAGIVHKWGNDERQQHFTLNMLNINSLSVDEARTSHD
jgi:hypothetical protein